MTPRSSGNWLKLKRTALSGLVVAILMISTKSALINTGAHFPASIDSRWTTSPPLIDGNMTSLEWSDATVVNLTSVPGNKLASYLLVKNDAGFLYLCYDAIGDDSFDVLDTASMAFDTNHDGIETAGREDQFIAGFRVYSAHLISDGSGNWTVHDSPVNDSLPNHTGLAVAYGFGQSDFASNVHRIYEFRIPLPLLGVSPGDAIGFLAGSQYFAGVLDYSDSTQSTWPRRFLGPQSLDKFGTLHLNAAPDVADLLVDPLEQWNIGEPGTSVDYVFTVINEGTMAPDVFDFNVSSIWNVTLYDLVLSTPLTDTDLDGLNDTGSLGMGVGKAILARVDIPPTATGSNVALLNISSSLDLTVHLLGRLYTEIPIARFAPPHNDYGIDLDFPPDGLYDQLRVEISVAVEVGGAYSFEGYLYDQSKTRVIANAYNTVNLLPGSNVGILGFNGVAICSSGIDGPYLVEVTLFDSEYDFLTEGTHLTAPYSHAEFDAPGAMLNPPHDDYGHDDDMPPNGLFDFLVVEVQVNVSMEGVYWIDVWLGHGITFQLEVPYLLPGLQVVGINLRGSDIYIWGIDGPYLIEITLADNEFNLLDRNENFTSDYNHTDFDPPGAIFDPPHSDHGLDIDLPPNGLYDHLVINASIYVYDEGLYDIWIDLFGADEITMGNTTEFLTAGSRHVEVLLNGSHIFASGSDGPYNANLVLFNSTGWFLDYDAYTTGFYSFTDFDPRASNPPPPPTNLSAHLEDYALENVNISWSHQGNGGNESLVHRYDIFYGNVLDWNGNGYELLDSVPDTGEETYYYLHESAGEGDPNNYFYYVCGVSLTNGSSCTSSQVGKFTRPFDPGPNLISIPLVQSNESIETVLQTVKYDRAWYYDSPSQEWKWYMKSKGYRRDLWNINHTMGVWVNVTTSSNLTVAGVVPAQTTIHLHRGWNLIAFPSFDASYTVADLKAEVPVERVEAFDSSAPPCFLKAMQGSDIFLAGEGYWVKVTEDTSWVLTQA